VDSVSEKWKCGRSKDTALHTPCKKCLTIKSDDVLGRSKAYESIIKGEPIKSPNIPASFHVWSMNSRVSVFNVELKGAKIEASEVDEHPIEGIETV
jgi:hypothetical protein